MAHRSRRRLIATVLVLLAIAGCGTVEEPEEQASGNASPSSGTPLPTASPSASASTTVEPTDPTTIAETDVTPYPIPTQESGANSQTALLEGTLIDDDGCLRVVGDGVAEMDAPFILWPYGWTTWTDGQTVVLRNHHGEIVARVGDQVSMGGGFWDITTMGACSGNMFAAGDQVNSTSFPVEPEPTPAPRVAGFPQLVDPIDMDAQLFGTIALVDGCLRINPTEGSESYLVIWPPDVEIIDVAAVVRQSDDEFDYRAWPGAEVVLGGGEIAQLPPDIALSAPIPEGCVGPFWLADTVQVAELVARNGQPAMFDNSGRSYDDDIQYAAQFGTTLAEAVRRTQLQDGLGELQETLMANEADTFSSLRIEHEPTFHIVVRFTRDGEETLHPYISGTQWEEFIEVETARYTEAELIEQQEEANRILRDLGINAFSATNITDERVEVFLERPYTIAQVEADLAAAGLTLPEAVVLQEIGDR